MNCDNCSYVGLKSLANDQQSLEYPIIQRKRREKHENNEIKFMYNLGNDFHTNNPDEASEHFLRREFPEILESTTNSHDVIFVPDNFIYQSGIVKKVKQHRLENINII